ncbi:MAG: DUF1697 domain-containing protein [Pyrinomonadaceae bacterium]
MKYVAFLRGINVGGHNKIKMETLREMVAARRLQKRQNLHQQRQRDF